MYKFTIKRRITGYKEITFEVKGRETWRFTFDEGETPSEKRLLLRRGRGEARHERRWNSVMHCSRELLALRELEDHWGGPDGVYETRRRF